MAKGPGRRHSQTTRAEKLHWNARKRSRVVETRIVPRCRRKRLTRFCGPDYSEIPRLIRWLSLIIIIIIITTRVETVEVGRWRLARATCVPTSECTTSTETLLRSTSAVSRRGATTTTPTPTLSERVTTTRRGRSSSTRSPGDWTAPASSLTSTTLMGASSSEVAYCHV